MADLINEFSWSQSRDSRFHYCRRQYFLTHYGSWGGWDWKADDRTKELYVMKNLKTRPMWVGAMVHDLAHWVVVQLARGQEPSLNDTLARLRRRMRSDWETSHSGRFRQRPSKLVGLSEHYYGLSVTDADLADDYGLAVTCLRNLFGTWAYKALASDPSVKLLEAEELRSFDVSGVKVWLVIDLALRLGDGQIAIIDWKTGSNSGRETARRQLAVYALYASRTWSISAGRIATREVNLRYASETPFPVDDASLSQAEDYIVTSAQQMLDSLADPASNLAREQDFPKADSLEKCRSCAFRRACDREDA